MNTDLSSAPPSVDEPYVLNTYLHQVTVRLTIILIALFSVSKHIHWALVVCNSEWVSVILHRVFFEYPIKWCTYRVVQSSHGWCHGYIGPWLMPCETAAISPQVLCVHDTTMHQSTVSLYSKPRWVHVCLSVTCPHHMPVPVWSSLVY